MSHLKRDKTLQRSKTNLISAYFTVIIYFSSIYELEIHIKRYSWLLKFTTDFSEELMDSESDLAAELSQFSERLQEIIEIHVKRTLMNSEDSDNVKLLLGLCQEMNKMNLFEASFKMALVYPTLESILQSSVTFKGSPLNFIQFIEQTSIFIKNLKANWSEYLRIFCEEEHKFWTRTVLSPILAWIVERCSSVFNPIDLDEFKRNFEAGLKFVSDFEGEFFFYEDELLFFRSQPAWINFMKKWALHQYYQSRTKPIITAIENVMSCGLELGKEMKIFDPTLVTINALKHIWTDDVILKPLIPKFLKFTLQTFRRFIYYCTEEASIHRNPKIFLLSTLHKQFNLERFVELVEENLMPQFQKHLDFLETGLSEQILNKLKEEVHDSLKKSCGNLVPGIENLYDQLINREELKLLNLEALKLLKESKVEVAYDMHQLIQQILLKFNRIIFKLIDEKRMNIKNAELIEKMKLIEGEADELGYPELVKEEFWLEIKAAIN